MRIAISTDSSCDLTKEQIQKYNINVIPFQVTLGDEERIDGVNLTSQDIFDYYDKTKELAKTSAINSEVYKQEFNKLLKEYDAVIHISLSFEVSSTGNNARLAAQEVGEDKVFVIDSKSLSTGQGLVVLKCVDLIEKDLTAKEIVDELESIVNRVQASFVINRLNYLHKGGRCSSVALLGANILKIKPKISLTDGKMHVAKKYMGKYEDVIKKYVEETLKENPPDLHRAFCTYSSKMPISDEIEKRLKEYGFKEVYQSYASSTISAHCGPETIGILYIKK